MVNDIRVVMIDYGVKIFEITIIFMPPPGNQSIALQVLIKTLFLLLFLLFLAKIQNVKLKQIKV